jgi:hypothetical protein
MFPTAGYSTPAAPTPLVDRPGVSVGGALRNGTTDTMAMGVAGAQLEGVL